MKAGIAFLRKNVFDAGLIIFLVLLAFLLAGRPAVGNSNSVRHRKEAPGREVGVRRQAPEKTSNTGDGGDRKFEALDARNIFSSDGSYDATSHLQRIPEKPYNLIGVLRGAEKKAVFREYNGDVAFVKAGDRLSDGTVVTAIGTRYVKTRKGSETKEYRIFDVTEGKTRWTGTPSAKSGKGQNTRELRTVPARRDVRRK